MTVAFQTNNSHVLYHVTEYVSSPFNITNQTQPNAVANCEQKASQDNEILTQIEIQLNDLSKLIIEHEKLNLPISDIWKYTKSKCQNTFSDPIHLFNAITKTIFKDPEKVKNEEKVIDLLKLTQFLSQGALLHLELS